MPKSGTNRGSFRPGMEVPRVMAASIGSRLGRSAIGAWTVLSLASAVATTFAAEAVDVRYPATAAYYRNYDPFDQPAAPSVAEGGVVAPGDVHPSTEFQLLGAEQFGQSAAVPATRVVPAAMQLVSPPKTEALPPPQRPAPPANVGRVDEPGADWAPRPLAELTTNIVLPSGMLPRDYWNERAPQHVAFFDPTGTTRGWSVNEFSWVASGFFCNPLYFEEINLERYGYGCGCFGPCCSNIVQSTVSGAHFFANVVALPYKMGADCPFECDYTLGHYRPGSCPPWRWHCCSRCSALGTMTAGGVAAGLIVLIP